MCFFHKKYPHTVINQKTNLVCLLPKICLRVLINKTTNERHPPTFSPPAAVHASQACLDRKLAGYRQRALLQIKIVATSNPVLPAGPARSALELTSSMHSTTCPVSARALPHPLPHLAPRLRPSSAQPNPEASPPPPPWPAAETVSTCGDGGLRRVRSVAVTVTQLITSHDHDGSRSDHVRYVRCEVCQ